MATFLLVHGAGDSAFSWHLLIPELERAGHACIAPDLPDGESSLAAHVDALVAAAASPPNHAHADPDAAGARRPLVVVAQSFGAFAGTLAASRLGADLLVLVAGMVPRAGESPDDWWQHTRWSRAPLPKGLTEREIFFHDVPDAIADQAEAHARDGTLDDLDQPLEGWTQVPTRFVLGTEDRFFPADWLRGVVRDRLGITPDELPGGHCLALSRPAELAALLASYLDQL